MSVFQFKYFSIQQNNSALKVGTDAMVLGALVHGDYQTILDIGTGTGVLALMLKQKNVHSKVLAIDIDNQSLTDCKINFENSIWSEDLICKNEDIFTYDSSQLFDCIVCNPPYYENGLLSSSDILNRAKHTFDFSLECLFTKVKSLLTVKGSFWVILPIENAEKWFFYCENIQLYVQEYITIYGKQNLPKRIVMKMGLEALPTDKKDFVIRDNENIYTEEYRKLTSEFHNKKI